MENNWLVLRSNMKNITILLSCIYFFHGCGKESQIEDIVEPEEVITFEKDVDNVKTAVRQTNDGGYIVAGGRGGQAWLLKLDKYGSEDSGKNLPFSSLSEDLKKKEEDKE